MSTAMAVPSEDTAKEISGKFLTFVLDNEEYGLEILKVHEIIGLMRITRVPRTPEHVMGVVNLRGKVIPVVDLRLKFCMEPIEPTPRTCIIVVQSQGLQFGLVVDQVSEVVDWGADDVDDPPSLGQGVNTDYILGVGKSEERVTFLLDIDRVLSNGDFDSMAVMTEDA
jgi:purine-binding chemotaxis protein CheW